MDLPEPLPEYRNLDAPMAAYKELGAIPYRPTPRGSRPPTDPALVEAVALRGADAEYRWRSSRFFFAAAVSFCSCGIAY